MLSVSFMAIIKLEVSAYFISSGILIIAFLLINIIFTIKKNRMKRLEAYKHSPSLFYYRDIIMPTMVILFISTMLIVVQIASFGSTINKSQESTLGQFTVDGIFGFQLLVLISAFILSILGLSECLNTLFYTRKSEFNMYHIIGWSERRILLHLSKETLVWTSFYMFRLNH